MPLTVEDQPYCLLVHPVDETITGSGVDNDVPLEFTTTQHNVGCTVNAAKSRITVPIAGTYLLSTVISGGTQTADAGDGIRLKILKNGSQIFESSTFPMDTFGTNNGEEFAFTMAIPAPLAASDYLEVALDNVGGSVSATVQRGYFSVVKLH